MKRRPPPHLYRVRFQRRGWRDAQYKYFLDPRAANRHVRKLEGYDRPDLAPLTDLTIERVPLGAKWEPVEWRELHGREWFR